MVPPTAPGASERVQFGRVENQQTHSRRHLEENGIDVEAAQRAIRADIARRGRSAFPTGNNQRIPIMVGGRQITYSAYRLPDGTINVGRITVP